MQNSQHTVKSLLDFVKQKLEALYPAQEVQALSRILFSEFAGIAPAQRYISLEKKAEENVAKQIQQAVAQLQTMRPIQQILGKAEFYGMTFFVNEHTLIPRPETEELVEWIISDLRPATCDLRLLDIGTGSGCIAISLAKNIPHSEVAAWDISENALEVAQKNAAENNVNVKFEQVDILNSQLSILNSQFNVVVSNPPYVCQSEKAQMRDNVLRYEPHTALFVEDSNPLVFYSVIADFAKKSLAKSGFLYFEINAMFGNETVEMLKEKGFENIVLRKDINGKDRMIRASLN
ncbi:MAG: peptide chain release factor N(5)-glutamine methyltransferase [Prevotellaceae bacterium]|jgi:release factor glutamine methyltransferase|nr:peptide chain release factor N(5)-glutamine methyltransferase [Prevotellaceae bacterium]